MYLKLAVSGYVSNISAVQLLSTAQSKIAEKHTEKAKPNHIFQTNSFKKICKYCK